MPRKFRCHGQVLLEYAILAVLAMLIAASAIGLLRAFDLYGRRQRDIVSMNRP
ncbi:MAG: hypothetical protein PHS41_04250 [Victivallaceae bacterium]|nr:hypothetical protein [Victivallaceae bacterium]